jgi:type I restriction enzyme S subunit
VSWRRLKTFADVRVSNVDKKSAEDESPVRLCNYTDVYYRSSIATDQEFMRATASSSQVSTFRLRAGDVLVTKDSETADDIGVAAYVESSALDLVCGYHLAIIRPDPAALDSRFLYWFICSTPAREQMSVAATGVTRYGLRSGDLGSITLPVPVLHRQVAIARYLDRETKRIDALVSAKRRLLERIAERYVSTIESQIWNTQLRLVPLKHLVDVARPIMYGIVLPGPDVGDGVPIVKGGDVAAKRLSPDLLSKTTPEIESPYARARLRAGDLLFAIRGGIGDVAIVPSELMGANITQDVARIAPIHDVDPEWLTFVLETSSVKRQVAERTTGATIRGLNIWDLARIMVPLTSIKRHREDLGVLLPMRDRYLSLRQNLRRQITLLAEHRQALITAAVTGELDIAKSAA